MTIAPAARSRKWLDALMATGAFVVALAIRVVPSFGEIVTKSYVRFREVDAWYHMRLVDALAHNFPLPIRFDPYFGHYGSHAVPVAPLWGLVLYVPSWLIGFGSPSPRLIDVTAAIVPSVCGALTCAIVWFIARDLWGRTAASLAAFTLAFMPSQFFQRTLVGYADHHAGEVLFSTLFLALLFRLIAVPNEAPKRRILLIGLTGLALSLNLLVWTTAGLTVAIVLVAVVAHFAVALAKKAEVRFLPALAATLAVALVLVVPWTGYPTVRLSIAALLTAIPAVLALAIGERAVRRGAFSRRWAGFGLVVLLVAGVAIIVLGFPHLMTRLGDLLIRLKPSPTKATVGETLSLADVGYRAIFSEYLVAAVAAPIGFVFVARDWWRRFDPRLTTLLAWTVTMAGLTAAQIRFSYYLSIEVALLAGCCGSLLLGWIMKGAREPATEKDRVYSIVALVGIALVLVGPEIQPALATSRETAGPDRAWEESMVWLRDHSPEPFASGSSYTARLTEAEVATMKPSYRVLSWWDYGYWMMRIAHRVPVANPTQEAATPAARFFLSQSEPEAMKLLANLDAGYVVTNHDLLVLRYSEGLQVERIFPAMAVWAGVPIDTYYDTWEYQTDKGAWLPVRMFYPAYFRTMAVRLELTGGKRYVPDRSVWIARWDDHREENGRVVKRVRSLVQYPTWEAARDALDASKDPRARIVSIDPFASCVPLDPIDQMHEVWKSDDGNVKIWKPATDLW